MSAVANAEVEIERLRLALEAAISERDAAKTKADNHEFAANLYFGEKQEAEARVTALEKALADFAQRIDNDGTASQIVSADEIRELLSLSPKPGDEKL